jgi:hypothetical protein
MRQFEFIVFDDKRNILDRYVLDNVEKPQGLGFTQEITVVSTNTIDYITDRALKKKSISMTVLFENPGAYAKANNFRTWYCKHIKDTLTLKYTDDVLTRYIDVAITEFQVSEIDTGYNSVPISLQPLSPFYLLKLKKVITEGSGQSKAYPYGYPYSYSGGMYKNNEIINEFFEPAPLRVEITGRVSSPDITLRDELGEVYAELRFNGITLYEGESLVIDAINTKIEFYPTSGAEPVDYYDKLDKSKNTFLYAKPGISTITANLNNDLTASLNVTYVQYVL